MICSTVRDGHKLRVFVGKIITVFQRREGSKKDRGASKCESSPNIFTNKTAQCLVLTSVNVILSHVYPAPIFINFSHKIHINVIDPADS